MHKSKLVAGVLFLLCLAGTTCLSAQTGWEKVATCDAWELFYDPGSGAVYAITHDQGILKSTDGGLTWTAKNTGLDAQYWINLEKMAADNSGNLLLSFTRSWPNPSTVFRSSDAGETWQQAAAAGRWPDVLG